MRWLALVPDPNSDAGGSNLDTLLAGGSVAWDTPTTWVPVTTAQVDPGYTDTTRSDEVRGTRGSPPPVPYQAMPQLTFSSRLYPSLAKLILPRVLGKIAAATGSGSAARVTACRPVPDGKLPALEAWLVREDQLDRLTGLWIEQVVLNVGTDDPMIEVTARALFHDTDVSPADSSLPTADYSAYDNPYAGVTFTAKTGAGSGTKIACVGDFSLTFNNHFEADPQVQFCKGENLLVQNVGGKYRRRQYPGRHILGEQEITGNIAFGTTRADMEDRRLLATAERLVATLTGDPIGGASPAADESLALELPSWVLSGGGADALVRQGAIKSAYDFGGFVDPTSGDDIIARFTAAAAVTAS